MRKENRRRQDTRNRVVGRKIRREMKGKQVRIKEAIVRLIVLVRARGQSRKMKSENVINARYVCLCVSTSKHAAGVLSLR